MWRRKRWRQVFHFQVYSVVQTVQNVLQVKFRQYKPVTQSRGHNHCKHTPVFTQHASQLLHDGTMVRTMSSYLLVDTVKCQCPFSCFTCPRNLQRKNLQPSRRAKSVHNQEFRRNVETQEEELWKATKPPCPLNSCEGSHMSNNTQDENKLQHIPGEELDLAICHWSFVSYKFIFFDHRNKWASSNVINENQTATKPKLIQRLLLWQDFSSLNMSLTGRSPSSQHPVGASPPSADLGSASLVGWGSLPAAWHSPRRHCPPAPADGSPSGAGLPEGSARTPTEWGRRRNSLWHLLTTVSNRMHYFPFPASKVMWCVISSVLMWAKLVS